MGLPERKELPRRRPWVSRDINAFETKEQIGEGTYGEVWRARDKETDEDVALKKVRMEAEREGFPLTAIREIKLLKMLRHENIVNLKEIVTGKEGESKRGRDSIYMVFEYMDHDLTGLLDTPDIRFTESQVKCYVSQLLQGLCHCHSRDILHRDIKGSNLLIDNQGRLKIADFGLARIGGEPGRGRLTNKVITLWYRPPELLLGECVYGKAVDVWSCGCLLAELLIGRPLLKGQSEPEQMDLIFNMFGRPTDAIWPTWRKLPEAALVREDKYPPHSTFRKAFSSKVTSLGLDLVEKMMSLDPSRRISAEEALNHEWFRTQPVACKPSDLPKYDSVHEFQARQRKEEARQKRARHQPLANYDKSRDSYHRGGYRRDDYRSRDSQYSARDGDRRGSYSGHDGYRGDGYRDDGYSKRPRHYDDRRYDRGREDHRRDERRGPSRP